MDTLAHLTHYFAAAGENDDFVIAVISFQRNRFFLKISMLLIRIGGKSQKCFWEPEYQVKNFLPNCVCSQGKNLSKKPYSAFEIPLKHK